MNRKDFLLQCGACCVGVLGFSSLLSGCSGTKYIDAAIDGDELLVPSQTFLKEGTVDVFLPHVIAQNQKLEYPLVIFRSPEVRYTALLMRCTHQGTELQVFGDRLQCPAHGSEFNSEGKVQNGPADVSLRKFAVSADEQYVRVKLS
jgi:Rieske Fe-S protein